MRRAIIDELIASHRGRIFNTAGDSVVADFASAVDAVQCAVAVQGAIATGNAGGAADEPMQFRIGVHVGDVMVDGDNLLGDGVNIAARLEAMAEPGGVCVSARVQEDTAGKLDLAFQDLGEQTLRNIARPIRVYSLAPATTAARPKPRARTAGVPRLSIAVLPFANLSSDPEQEYFADAVTEDVTTNLSRNIGGLFVIAHGTALTYRSKPVDPKTVGRELGVQYVLEGSVRRLGQGVRISAQLIDCDTAAHVWADRYDGAVADLFMVQDEITSRIAVALDQTLTFAEASRPIESAEALDYFLRGRATLARMSQTRQDFVKSVDLFERALALGLSRCEQFHHLRRGANIPH
jgi:TolB-like protein